MVLSVGLESGPDSLCCHLLAVHEHAHGDHGHGTYITVDFDVAVEVTEDPEEFVPGFIAPLSPLVHQRGGCHQGNRPYDAVDYDAGVEFVQNLEDSVAVLICVNLWCFHLPSSCSCRLSEKNRRFFLASVLPAFLADVNFYQELIILAYDLKMSSLILTFRP